MNFFDKKNLSEILKISFDKLNLIINNPGITKEKRKVFKKPSKLNP